MKKHENVGRVLLVILVVLLALPGLAAEPWIISSDEVITAPAEVGDVILVGDGSLVVTGVGEPGLRVSGHIWALGSSEVRFEDSVIQFMSTYHGQYALVAAENARIEVTGCSYRVPNGVQHGLVSAGDARLRVADTDFGEVQLVAAERSSIEARRLNGHFEVIVQHDAHMVLEDIPRRPDGGNLWVWPEFPRGSVATYSPPMPGFVQEWDFPPEGSSGIVQTVHLEHCEVMLWPLLVQPGCDLTLRDVAEDNWMVVGLHLSESAIISRLVNGSFTDQVADLDDRTIRLVNASIDTWNLYPQESARVLVNDCVLGEILAMGSSDVVVERTLIDGSGGFFGARDESHITVHDSQITCTVEASQSTTIELHNSVVAPYPQDPTGDWTRFGAFDDGRLLADTTPVLVTPVLGGRGLIGVTWIADPPAVPPGPGETVTLSGSAALFSLDGGPAPGFWKLQAVSRQSRPPVLIASGVGNVEEAVLGTWSEADPLRDYWLRITLTDRWGRVLVGRQSVHGFGGPVGNSPRNAPGAGSRVSTAGDRRPAPAGARFGYPSASTMR